MVGVVDPPISLPSLAQCDASGALARKAIALSVYMWFRAVAVVKPFAFGARARG